MESDSVKTEVLGWLERLVAPGVRWSDETRADAAAVGAVMESLSWELPDAIERRLQVLAEDYRIPMGMRRVAIEVLGAASTPSVAMNRFFIRLLENPTARTGEQVRVSQRTGRRAPPPVHVVVQLPLTPAFISATERYLGRSRRRVDYVRAVQSSATAIRNALLLARGRFVKLGIGAQDQMERSRAALEHVQVIERAFNELDSGSTLATAEG
jgi:hypothetical protein